MLSIAPQMAAATRKSKPQPKAAPPENKVSEDAMKWFTKGNKVTALYDASVTPKNHEDEIFVQVKDAIQNAGKSIQLEMFGFGQEDIAKALVAAKKDRGVNVQVVLDPVNPELDWEKEKGDMARILEKGGIDVKWYPVSQGGGEGEGKFPQIDHVKMLITDGDKAIIGGMNWGSHSPNNHDVDVMVEGPIVDKMEALFGKDYLKAGGKKSDLIPIEKSAVAGDTPVSLLTTSEELKDRSVKAALLRAIREADHDIAVEQFCFTDWSVSKALVDAKTERGVNVRVLMDPFEIEGKKLNEATEAKLEAAGIPVKWYEIDPKTGGKLHAKLGIFDGEEVILGSANWSGSGLTWNHEADVDVIDKKVAGDYLAMFENDWKKAADKPTY